MVGVVQLTNQAMFVQPVMELQAAGVVLSADQLGNLIVYVGSNGRGCDGDGPERHRRGVA